MKSFNALFIIILCTSFTFTALPQSWVSSVSQNSWTSMAPIPTGRTELVVGTWNGKIYAIGGFLDSYIITDINEVYNPSTDSWDTKASAPTMRGGGGAGVVNDKVYVIGGGTDQNPVNTNEEYDPVTDTWTTKAPMPTARNGPAVIVFNDSIYVIGGQDGSNYLTTNEMYDPATNNWTTKAPIPTGRVRSKGATVNNKIYVMGGWLPASGTVATNHEYDPVTNTWTTRAPMPAPRMAFGIGVVNNKIYAIGGSQNGPGFDTNEEYNPATDSWTTWASMPTARTLLDVGAVDSMLYAIGGSYNWPVPLDVNERYTPPVPGPNITVSDDTLNFGQVFIGATDSLNLVVSNTGTQDLLISSAITNPSEYAISPSFASIYPGDSKIFIVSFTPMVVGHYPGTLTFISNDPDPGNYIVTLAGQGVEPPIISISPDSLSENLFSGEISTQTLTISNTGSSDLIFDISAEEITRNFLKMIHKQLAPLTKLSLNPLQSITRSDYRNEEGNSYITFTNSELSQFKQNLVAYYKNLKEINRVAVQQIPEIAVVGSYRFDMLYVLLGDTSLANRYQFVEVADYETYSNIENFDGLIVVEGDAEINFNEATSINLFYNSHKPITLGMDDLDDNFNYYPGTDVLLMPVFGISNVFDGDFYFGSLNPNNPIIAGVSQVFSFGVDNDWYTLNGSDWIFAGTDGNYYGVSNEGLSNTALMGENLYYIWGAGNEQLIRNAINWMMEGVGWLSITPETGIVPPSSSVDIQVTFDATSLSGGDYHADILINSNDPIEPLVTVPAHLHITGAPNIALELDTVDFGQVFIGASDSLDLVVTNTGSQDLLISSVIANPSEYTVSPTFAAIYPGDSKIFIVSFSPLTVGNYPGILTFTSNDPDSSNYIVNLAGQGVEPPIISVSPDSLNAALSTGDTTTQTITIFNTGFSDLEWIINIEGAGLGIVTSTKQDYADWTDPANQDWITDNVHITRADNQGIFNVVTETGYSYGSPDDTEWAFGYTANLDSSDYQIWRDAVYPPPSMVGQPLSLHLITDDKYFDVMFHSWTSGNNGGGFSYTRTDVDPQWLTVSQDSGIVPPGSFVNVDVIFDATGLFGGDYFAEIIINSNDPITPELNVPVYLDVTGAPDIAVKIAPYDSTSIIYWYTSDATTIHTFYTPFTSVSDGDLTVTIDGDYDNSSEYADVYIENDLIGTINPNINGPTTQIFTITESDLNNYISDDTVVVTVDNSPEVNTGYGNDFHSVRLTYPTAVDTLDFHEVFVNDEAHREIVIENNGTDSLDVSSITVNNTAFTVSPSSLTIGYGEEDTVLVSFLPPAVGSYAGIISIVSNDPNQGLIEIPVAGEGIEPPIISVSPDSLSAALLTGDTATQTLTISNSGGSALNFDISVGFLTEMRSQNYALQFDGVDDYVEIPNAINGLGAVTIEAWFLYVNSNIWRWIYGGGPVYNDNPGMCVGEGSNLMRYHWRTTTDFFDDQDGSITLIQNAWYHIAYVYDGSTIRSYINGIEDFSRSSSGTVLAPLTQAIGAAFWNNNECFYGTIDEVRIWNVGRTQAEIQADMNHEISGTEPGLLAYWRFNEGTGYIAYDQTANSNDGTLQNGVGWILSTAPISLGWLSVMPSSGSIAAGSSSGIMANFDAAGLSGGEYDATIVISSNDPNAPDVPVPAHLHVTGAPNIVVSPDSIEFGDTFVGQVKTDTLTVMNAGTDSLIVNNITLSDTVFGSNLSSFIVLPNEEVAVFISFMPPDTGIYLGYLTITSNDSNASVIDIPLQGGGVFPPSLMVWPDTLSTVLEEGDSTTISMAIMNSGAGILNWSIEVTAGGEITPSSSPVKQLTVRFRELGATDIQWQGNQLSYRLEGEQKVDGEIQSHAVQRMTTLSSSLNNVHVMFVNNDWSSFQIELEAKGAHTSVYVDSITPAVLDTVDVLVIDSYFMSYPPVIIDIHNWVSGGGALLIDSDQALTEFNTIIAGSGISFINLYGMSGITTDITPHPTTTSISSYEIGGAAFASLDITGNALDVIRDTINVPHVAVADLGSGRVVAIADEDLHNPDLFLIGHLDLGLNSVGWLAIPKWCTISPTSGTVLPGDSTILSVEMCAAGLSVGSYSAALEISCNDPLHPTTIVPLYLQVDPGTGIKDPLADQIPKQYVLYQNYPNPFNPVTHFRFGIPNASKVKIELYNVLGQRVKTILEDRREAGFYTIDFDASSLASGVYFYRFEADKFIRIKKLMLLK